MYGIICDPNYWDSIEKAITMKDEQILFKVVEKDVDIESELEKLGRISIKYLIIDLTVVKNEDIFIDEIRRYRILNDSTQIIIIAPNFQPPSMVLHSMVAMGIYNIVAPSIDDNENEDVDPVSILIPLLLEVIEHPCPYKKAVRWFIEDKQGGSSQASKTREIVHVPVIKDGLKETIITYGWNSSGKSFFITNLASALARAGAKVALIEGNFMNRELGTFFRIDKNTDGLEKLLQATNEEKILSFSHNPLKNLFVFPLLNHSKLSSKDFNLADIQDKLRGKVDFILVDGIYPVDSSFLPNLKFASKVYVVVNPNIAKLIYLSKELGSLASQGINLGKFEGILNHYEPSKEFTIKAIEDLINIDIRVKIPPLYPMSFDSHILGKPLCMNSKGEDLEEAIEPILNNLWTIPEAKKSIFSKLKNPFK
ncbi:MAG: hypothetical protein AB7G87_01275 [Clostridia bacterium]